MTAMGFAITGVGIPMMLYVQKVLAYTALRSAPLMVPMAVVTIRRHARVSAHAHPGAHWGECGRAGLDLVTARRDRS